MIKNFLQHSNVFKFFIMMISKCFSHTVCTNSFAKTSLGAGIFYNIICSKSLKPVLKNGFKQGILCFPSLHFSDHCTKLVLNGLRRYQRAALCILMQSPLDDISHFHTYTNRHPAPDSESADTHFLSAAAFP